MYEIKVADLATDSPDFGVVRCAVLGRYDRLHKQHVPDGGGPEGAMRHSARSSRARTRRLS